MRSIRLQFIGFMLAVLMILLVMLNIYPLTSARDQIMEEKRVSLSGKAAVIASALGSAESLSYSAVKDVLSFLDVDSLNRILVADADGCVVYDNGDSSEPDLENLQEALGSKTVFKSSFRDSAFSSSAAQPVCFQGAIIGAVEVYELDTDRAQMIETMQARIRTVSLIVGAVALVIVATFSEVLVRRIRLLVDSIRKVAGGDYDYRMEIQGKDEISELGREFNLLTERLDTTEKQRRRFVSDASHELKTPLASIRLLSDSIVQNENIDNETLREFVSDIGDEATRLQHTTEKLLDLSRLDDGVQIIPEPVDLKQTVADALFMLNPLAGEKNVHFKCQLDDGCVCMATVDDMFHIVFNLMENAVKYNVPGGLVTVTVSGDDEKVRVKVADTGIGIPEEDRLNIFGRFYRVDKARSREAGGSGLGLSIVHDAVIAHGGTVSVGANKPKGSVFIVEFPKPTSEETGI